MTWYSLLICNAMYAFTRSGTQERCSWYSVRVPMCQCIVSLSKNWVVSDVPTWSRRSYAIDCEYSSSSAPAPSTYKHSTYLGPSSDTIAITISQLRTRWIFNWKCERCCESSELILVFSSRHEFVLSNLCRLYCYNLNNSINSFFSAKQVLLFYIVDNLFVGESERNIFSVGK